MARRSSRTHCHRSLATNPGARALMNATDSGNEPTQPNDINRRELLVGTASVVALTAAITAQPAAAQAPTARAPAGPPGGSRGPVIKAGSVTFNTVITKLAEGKQIFSNTL